jgi:hypothetical protein
MSDSLSLQFAEPGAAYFAGPVAMQKLGPVEEAKALMTEAKEWSLWKWLWEKKNVRVTADRANEALDALEKKVKASWSDDLKKAYRELEARADLDGNPRGKQRYEKAREEAKHIDAELKRAVQRVKEADDEAYQAHLDAEETFDEADRRLSTDTARKGTQKAIDSWDLREKAIRKAEALGRKK